LVYLAFSNFYFFLLVLQNVNELLLFFPLSTPSFRLPFSSLPPKGFNPFRYGAAKVKTFFIPPKLF